MYTGLLLPVCFVLLFTFTCTCIADNNPEPHILVFKPDGTKQCEPDPGVTLNFMEMELSSKGITVFTKQKGHDGREGIALCGHPTGQINIYEIAVSDLSAAINLGFHELQNN